MLPAHFFVTASELSGLTHLVPDTHQTVNTLPNAVAKSLIH